MHDVARSLSETLHFTLLHVVVAEAGRFSCRFRFGFGLAGGGRLADECDGWLCRWVYTCGGGLLVPQ